MHDERFKHTQGECLFERALGCPVCIWKWLFHCRRSKKLIHQKKWSFGNSRKRTEAIWGSGFQFLYSFLEKVCSGLSQTKLFLRSSFTQLWCTSTYQVKLSKFLRLSFFSRALFLPTNLPKCLHCRSKPWTGFPGILPGLEMLCWTRLNPLEALSVCLELCCVWKHRPHRPCRAPTDALPVLKRNPAQLESGNCCLGREGV